MESLLSLKGLRLESNGKRGKGGIALEIETLDIQVGDFIFVLADRKNGKSALRDTLKSIFCFHSASDKDLEIPQPDDPSLPLIQLRSFQRHPTGEFKVLSGDPEALAPAKHPYVLNYCDDPCLPHTSIGTGVQVMEWANGFSLTLMIGADPDRLEEAFRGFLNLPKGRVLWLDEGRVFWTGLALEFKSSATTLCSRYSELHPNPENGFLEAVRNAIQ